MRALPFEETIIKDYNKGKLNGGRLCLILHPGPADGHTMLSHSGVKTKDGKEVEDILIERLCDEIILDDFESYREELEALGVTGATTWEPDAEVRVPASKMSRANKLMPEWCRLQQMALYSALPLWL